MLYPHKPSAKPKYHHNQTTLLNKTPTKTNPNFSQPITSSQTILRLFRPSLSPLRKTRQTIFCQRHERVSSEQEANREVPSF
ncbi:hypothetical protein JTE90_013559 [Oedothorax gibbosus]|uniref:Uncharacterized protein n=1 Tax=Oedothorax gibbosus TaxID=931172 RepID=A0AAV6UB74_9ARAC|nr:hypothetical protein JTE90_013559 [Oedothorax gibbosus]